MTLISIATHKALNCALLKKGIVTLRTISQVNSICIILVSYKLTILMIRVPYVMNEERDFVTERRNTEALRH